MNETYRVLFVDDDEQAVASAMEKLAEAGNYDPRRCDFGDFERLARDFDPDLVVLDIMHGSPVDENATGIEIQQTIWNTHFRPVIFYTAFADHTDGVQVHPFHVTVQKGSGSEDNVLQTANRFLDSIKAVRAAEQALKREFPFVFRDTSLLADLAFPDPGDFDARKNLLVRSARRRIAALMDDLSRHEEKLEAWEQYICLPIGKDLVLGDVLRSKDGHHHDPRSFRIVLTPSCDLVVTPTRSAKVESVLLARCAAFMQGLAPANLHNTPKNKIVNRFPSSLLNSGYCDCIVALPELPNHIPHMVADMKKLELLTFDEIHDQYVRVASIDSPFREMINWAYIQTAGRPGLPDRDCTKWAQSIHDSLP